MAQGRTWRVITLLAVIVGAVAVAQSWPDIMPKRFEEVVEGKIYRSGKLTPAAFRTVVHQNDIRTIVDLGAWEPDSPGEALAFATARELGVDRVVLDLEGDATGDPNLYLQTLRIMTDPEKQPILVHCGAGTERTGCAIILYRHIIDGVTIEDAYKEAERAGHSPRRNPRLQGVLDRWTEPIADAYNIGLEAVPGAGPE